MGCQYATLDSAAIAALDRFLYLTRNAIDVKRLPRMGSAECCEIDVINAQTLFRCQVSAGHINLSNEIGCTPGVDCQRFPIKYVCCWPTPPNGGFILHIIHDERTYM